MTSSIIDFLEARLAEDEAVARAAVTAAGSPNWETSAESDTHGTVWASPKGMHGTPLADGPLDWDPLDPAVAAHMACHDPARVLREVQAKRAILEDHQIKPASWPEPDDQPFGCQRCHFDSDEGIYGFGYCPTLKALAAIYSDHPEFRKEWAA